MRKRRINLSRAYPISELHVLKQALPWLCLLCGMIGLRLYTGFPVHSHPSEAAAVVNTASLLAIMTIGVICLLEAWAAHLYRRRVYFGIEAGRIVLSKGILLRRRAAFPLAKVTDFYIGQTAVDWLLGLYYIEFATPSEQSARFARIDGFTLVTAQQLHECLMDAQGEQRSRRRRRRVRPAEPHLPVKSGYGGAHNGYSLAAFVNR